MGSSRNLSEVALLSLYFAVLTRPDPAELPQSGTFKGLWPWASLCFLTHVQGGHSNLTSSHLSSVIPSPSED